MADGNRNQGNLPAKNDLATSCPTRLLAQSCAVMDEPFTPTLRAEPEMIAAAQRWLPSLQAEASPATAEERVVIMVGLANVTGKPEVLRNGTKAAQLQFWAIYHELLGHLPSEVLRRSTMAFLKAAPAKGGDKWFPDPGTLLEFARRDEAYGQLLKATRGMERLSKAKPHVPGPLASDEDWERLNRQKLDAIKGRVKAEEDDQRARDREAFARFKDRAPAEQPFDHSTLNRGKAA